jgi:alanyl-tRNA synthetase
MLFINNWPVEIFKAITKSKRKSKMRYKIEIEFSTSKNLTQDELEKIEDYIGKCINTNFLKEEISL